MGEWTRRRVGKTAPAVAERAGGWRGRFAPSRDNDDLSSGVSLSLVPESVRDITQGEAPIDDRRDLTGFDELLQNTQVLSVVPHDEYPHPLAHKRR